MLGRVGLLAFALLVPSLALPGAALPPTVSIHEDLGAGEWLVAYVYVPEGTTVVSLSGQFSAYTQGPLLDQVGLFTMPPTAITERNGAHELLAGPIAPLVEIHPHGGGFDRSAATTGTIATSGVVGSTSIVAVQVAFAASHPWSLDLDLTVPQATFAVVHRYSGAVFAAPEPLAMPAVDTQEIAFRVPNRGWTHVSTEATHLYPLGLRNYDVRFPNGFVTAGSAQMLGGPSPTYWGGFGATDDNAGMLRAKLTYYEASLGAPLAIAHLPWPANHGLYDVDYRTTDDGVDFGLPGI